MTWWKRWRGPRVPVVKQRDATDCGAACLAAIASYHGLHLSVARVRQMAATDRIGTSLAGIITAAQTVGMVAKGVRVATDAIGKVPLPAIAHMIRENGEPHYVVVSRVRGGEVQLMDPMHDGTRWCPVDGFGWTGVLLLVEPGETFERGETRVAPVRRFWHLIRPHRTILLEALVGALVYTALSMGTAVFVQKIVDQVLVDANLRLLNLLGVGMLVLLAAQAGIGIGKNLITLRTGQRIDAQLLLGYYRHVLRLPQHFFDTMRVGDVIARVNDAIKIRAFINDTAVELLVAALVVVFSVALMAVYSWQLALLGLLLVPLYGTTYLVANRINRRVQREMMERNAELETQLVESLSGAATIKRLRLEGYAGKRFERAVVRLLRPVYRSAVAMTGVSHATDFASRAFGIVLLWVGARLVLSRDLTPGELLSCYALAGQLSGPIASIIGANRAMQDALIATERLFEILDLEQEPEPHGSDATQLPSCDVRLSSVGFHYGSRAPVFTNLSADFPAGQVTVVVGESGSGKSTIAALLHRLYERSGGTIAIGGVDIRHCSVESLRRVVGVVPQHLDLFAGSLLENITPGEATPDMQRVVRICAQLDLLPMIEALPDGFATVVGERGSNLSGGQRQRICIARTLYRAPRILVLDEATSALDARAERHVLTMAREHAASGGTVIMIAHRLSAAVTADRILVLERGTVVQTGTHLELLSTSGPYLRLWNEQMGEHAFAVNRLAERVGRSAIGPEVAA